MRLGLLFTTLWVGTSLPFASAQAAEPYARLELDGKCRSIPYSAFSPDAKMRATSHCWSHGPSFVTLWDTANGKQLRKIDGPKALLAFNPLAFSPDNKLLAVGGIDEI